MDSLDFKLYEVNGILHRKLEANPKIFETAVRDFCDGVVKMNGNDDQLAAALSGFGMDQKDSAKDDKEEKEKAKQAVPTWQQSLKIGKRSEDDDFHSVTGIAVHPSGDIALIDKNDNMDADWNRGSPRVYVFNPDGTQKFVLNSTDSKESPVGKLVNGQGIAVTNDGKYLVADGTTDVKVFDAAGTYLESFSTLSEDVHKGIKKSSRCVTVNRNSGEVLVGDFHRELVTVHNGDDFKLVKEIHVGLQPVHVAVNKKNQVAVCMMMHEPAEVVAVNFFYRVLSHKRAGGKVVAFDYSGDELFTIVPIMGDELAKPYGVVYDSDCGLYVAVTKFDISSRLAKPNTGHIHYYNSSGEFVKCVAKGLYWPLGMGIGKDLLAVADKQSARVFKPE
ncbi:uncharacterized protein [Amphiura filiformis]|uniref:uncharacterized protein n=1 Tax=Amphiura filiformis TaxID=82378 RepID=UPI003B2272E6